jgi:hypothetical protein
MNKNANRIPTYAAIGVFLLFAVIPCLPVHAQNPELQERVAQLRESTAQNKQQLAQYTWVEQVTISLKGEEKKQEKFQVKTGPDGKPVKTPIGSSPAPAAASQSSGGRGGRLKEHVVEKKKEEYKDYADRMKSLMETYVPPDKELLQRAVQNRNVTVNPVAGSSNQVQLVFHDYVKAKDSMTLVFDKEQKQVVGIQIASYLDDPSDAVNLAVKMARLPDGVSHVDSVVLEGVSKQIKVAIQNSNYQHL